MGTYPPFYRRGWKDIAQTNQLAKLPMIESLECHYHIMEDVKVEPEDQKAEPNVWAKLYFQWQVCCLKSTIT